MDSIKYDALLKGPVAESSFQGQRLCQLFSHLAKLHPHAIALKWQDEEACKEYEMTMEDLERKSNKLTKGILHHCSQLVAPNNDGDRVVMVCIPPSWKLVCTILAIWKAGASFLPVEPPVPQERVKHILQEVKPILVIADWDEEELFPDVNKISWTSLENISNDLSDRPLPPEEQYPMSIDPIEIILYTSGSTGMPKGVRIKSSSILNRLEWQWRRFPYEKEEKNCCFKTSIAFVDSVAEIWAPLLNPERPLSVLILPRSTTSNPQLLVPLLNNYNVSRLVLVPTLLKSILTYLKITKDNISLRQLKTWVCSGETLRCSLAKEFFDWSERNGASHILCNFYGSTEIMADVTYHVMKSKQDIEDKCKVPIGGPVYNTILYLLDAQMKLVNSGEIGELYVSGKQVAAGYVNGRDSFRFIENTLTADPECKTLFKTGDYASVNKGILQFEGRTDSQVKVRGNRVDLSEIEEVLNKLQDVQKGVVLCYNHSQDDQELVAFVLLNEGVSSEPTEIHKLLLKSLPSYAIPQELPIRFENFILRYIEGLLRKALSFITSCYDPSGNKLLREKVSNLHMCCCHGNFISAKVTIMDKIPLLVNGKIDKQHLIHHYSQLIKPANEMQFNIDTPSIANEMRPAMRCLMSAIASVLPHAFAKLTPQANFYNIGGNSLNTVLMIAKLNEAGYNISVSDFVRSETLTDIVNKMVLSTDGQKYNITKILNKYKFDQIAEKYKPDVYRIFSDSFTKRALIEKTLDPPVETCHYYELLDAIWPTIIKNPLSIVVKDVNTDEVISAAFLIDAVDEPSVNLQTNLDYKLQFLRQLELSVLKMIPKDKKILHSYQIATAQTLSPQENVEVIEAMEWKTEDIARQNGFVGIFTTNSNPLTRQLSATILGYKLLKSAQVNQFVASDGTRPFKRGDDSLIVTCAFKELN